MKITDLTEDNFDNFVKEGTVLVSFSAPWSKPCKLFTPVIESVASKDINLKVGIVNVDENLSIAQRYNITIIPAYIIFKDGVNVRESIGVVPEKTLMGYVNKFI